MPLPSIKIPASALGIIGQLYSCPNLPPPKINVKLSQSRLVTDNTRNRDQLATLNSSSLSPIYGGEFPIVNGLTSSNINVTADTSFTMASNNALKKGCIIVQNVDVKLTYSPTVYIYKNFRPGSCMYREVMEHEMQHVQVDKNALSAFKNYIKKATKYAVNATLAPDPLPIDKIEDAKINMAKSISVAVQFATKKMQEQLKTRQRQIDTREEYQRMSRVCPHEDKR